MLMKIQIPCVECGTVEVILVDEKDHADWQAGKMIQHAFPPPYLTASQREIMISGMCGGCFDEMFKGEV